MRKFAAAKVPALHIYFFLLPTIAASPKDVALAACFAAITKAKDNLLSPTPQWPLIMKVMGYSNSAISCRQVNQESCTVSQLIVTEEDRYTNMVLDIALHIIMKWRILCMEKSHSPSGGDGGAGPSHT